MLKNWSSTVWTLEYRTPPGTARKTEIRAIGQWRPPGHVRFPAFELGKPDQELRIPFCDGAIEFDLEGVDDNRAFRKCLDHDPCIFVVHRNLVQNACASRCDKSAIARQHRAVQTRCIHGNRGSASNTAVRVVDLVPTRAQVHHRVCETATFAEDDGVSVLVPQNKSNFTARVP
eukprot:1699304-Rhodomonas_salina.4